MLTLNDRRTNWKQLYICILRCLWTVWPCLLHLFTYFELDDVTGATHLLARPQRSDLSTGLIIHKHTEWSTTFVQFSYNTSSVKMTQDFLDIQYNYDFNFVCFLTLQGYTLLMPFSPFPLLNFFPLHHLHFRFFPHCPYPHLSFCIIYPF